MGIRLEANREFVKTNSEWMTAGSTTGTKGISLVNLETDKTLNFIGEELDPTATLESLGLSDVRFYLGRVKERIVCSSFPLFSRDFADRTSAKNKLNEFFRGVCKGLPSKVGLSAAGESDRRLKIEATGLGAAGVLIRLRTDGPGMRLLRMPEKLCELTQSDSNVVTAKWSGDLPPFQALPLDLAPFKVLSLTHSSSNYSFVQGFGFANLICELGSHGEVKNSEKFVLSGNVHLLQLVVVDRKLEPVRFREDFRIVTKVRFNSQLRSSLNPR